MEFVRPHTETIKYFNYYTAMERNEDLHEQFISPTHLLERLHDLYGNVRAGSPEYHALLDIIDLKRREQHLNDARDKITHSPQMGESIRLIYDSDLRVEEHIYSMARDRILKKSLRDKRYEEASLETESLANALDSAHKLQKNPEPMLTTATELHLIQDYVESKIGPSIT